MAEANTVGYTMDCVPPQTPASPNFPDVLSGEIVASMKELYNRMAQARSSVDVKTTIFDSHEELRSQLAKANSDLDQAEDSLDEATHYIKRLLRDNHDSTAARYDLEAKNVDLTSRNANLELQVEELNKRILASPPKRTLASPATEEALASELIRLRGVVSNLEQLIVGQIIDPSSTASKQSKI